MYHFLLIEDSEADIDSFQSSVNLINDEAEQELYKLSVAKGYDEAQKRISGQYNGLILDIKLDNGHDGIELFRTIIHDFRVPVAIFTATPVPDFDDHPEIRVYIKSNAKHEDILNDLRAVSDTGLFNVLSGTGRIEQIMAEIFWNNLYPKIDLWKEKKAQGKDVETILLRYAVSHIQERIDNNLHDYLTEEMYITPPVTEDIKTGSIVKSTADEHNYIVLSPPCDLAKRADGSFKTDSILVCKIENHDRLITCLTNHSRDDEEKKEKINKLIANNYSLYYHWLPSNALFEGGFINFRKVRSLTPNAFSTEFGKPNISIQDNFAKNILNRFSSYYSRQGQPDFNFPCEATSLYPKYGINPESVVQRNE